MVDREELVCKSDFLLYKGIKVKKMPWYLGFIFHPKKRCGMASSSQIFVSQRVYYELKNGNPPDPFCFAVLEHERTHLSRRRKYGANRYGWRYWFSSQFRLQEELMADQAMMSYLKRRNQSFPFERRAKILSSWLYLWMISSEEAKKKLSQMWEKVL